MLEIIGAAVLMAFGLLAVYFSLDGAGSDKNLFATTIGGLLAIIAGGWILITKLTLALILTKVAGLVLLGVGLFMIFGFPDSTDYQTEPMTMTGMLVGLVLAIIGGWLLFF